VGLLLRPAAFFGLLISLVFFLSATWRVRPYFYGSDIVFVFCWLTLLIAGPEHTGFPALDSIWVDRLLSPQQQTRFAALLAFFLGVARPSEVEQAQAQNKQVVGGKQAPGDRK